jgi:hypothetical protein
VVGRPRLPSLVVRLLGPVVVGALVAGCSSISGAARDRTSLEGKVPSGLGRLLEVSIEGADAPTTRDLLSALRAEFEGRDLFDRIEPAAVDSSAPTADAAGGGRRRVARLELALRSSEAREVFDTWKITTGYVVRFDLDVALHDPDGRAVLQGQVSGIAVDGVTDLDELDDARRDDMRVAALYDAASKLSRALRRTADDRAKEARPDLQRLHLPAGAGPVGIAVLGFDDEANARRLRGPLLVEQLAVALDQLGPDVAVATHEEVARALEADPMRGQLADLGATRADAIARELPSRLLVVGRVSSTAGRVTAVARVLDRSGKVLFSREATAEGLGAIRIVAVDLARGIGEGVAGLVQPPPPPG